MEVVRLLEMSASASILTALILLVRRAFLHRLPKRIFPILWWIAVLRLLLPVSIGLPVESPLSGMPGPGDGGWTLESGQKPAEKDRAESAQVRESREEIGEAPGLPGENEDIPEVWTWIKGVWLCGAGVVCLYFVWTHLRCRRGFSEALPVREEAVAVLVEGAGLRRKVKVKRSDRILTPCTYGVLRPVILLPKTVDLKETMQLQYLITHELVHIRRFDVLLKQGIAAAVCLHWFNPAVWLLYWRANRDIEIACDEAVVRQCGGEPRGYALTLLSLEEKRSIGPALSGFGANAVKERMVAIMKYRKVSVLSMALAATLVLGAASVFVHAAGAETKIDREDNQGWESTLESSVKGQAVEDSGGSVNDKSMGEGEAAESGGSSQFDGSELKEYQPYGIQADSGKEIYSYEGKPVAGLHDSGFYTLTDGNAEEQGGVYLIAERKEGELMGLEEVTREEFSRLTGLTFY